MPIYTKVKRKYSAGYSKDNVFIKTNRVPNYIREQLDAGMPQVEAPEAKNPCLLCEDETKRHRYLNQKSVGLCEYHYQHTSLGKIAQYMRENGLEEKPDIEKVEQPKPEKKVERIEEPAPQRMAGALAPKYGEVLEV